MLGRDYRDVIGGLALLLIGAGVAFYAFNVYPIGTLRRMGPGFFPGYLGVLLAILGASIIAPALLRNGPKILVMEWRALTFISIAGLFFALTINRLGIIPAVMGVVIISARADKKLNLKASVTYGAALALACWAIFSYALDLPVNAFRWRL